MRVRCFSESQLCRRTPRLFAKRETSTRACIVFFLPYSELRSCLDLPIPRRKDHCSRSGSATLSYPRDGRREPFRTIGYPIDFSVPVVPLPAGRRWACSTASSRNGRDARLDGFLVPHSFASTHGQTSRITSLDERTIPIRPATYFYTGEEERDRQRKRS